MATTLSSPTHYRPRDAVAAVRSSAWHAYTAVFAATCVIVGVYWDISWHMSIGRDTFWTPAHLVIQAGGLIAGFSSGYVALRTTFRGTDAEKEAAVSFWGFRAPLGAWILIWGCLAMLTSAPFDNWWHNAYGLDVKIISPPHAVLAIGIFAIVTGALLLTLAQQNVAAGERAQKRLAWLLAAVAGMFIMNFALFLTEHSERHMMHSAFFYQLVAATFPFGLAAMGRAIKLRWPTTSAAAFFTGIMLALMWTIEQFPATPKLGPIYQPVTHMITLSFPLLVIVPAFCFDLILRRFDGTVGGFTLALLLGAAFVITFVAAEWPFASFLMSPAARNPFFNADNFVYWMPPTYAMIEHRFDPVPPNAWPFPVQMLIAVALATASSALGLGRGAWMRRVRR